MKDRMIKEYTDNLSVYIQNKEPSLYQIFMHRDDFTPREFVVMVLEKFFYMERRKAIEVMTDMQEKGKAVCGLFTKDCAEVKVNEVVKHAASHDHPLYCSMEIA